MLLPVCAPFHCALMQPAADAMAEALADGDDRAAGGAAGRQCHGRSRSAIRTTIREPAGASR